MAKHKWSGDIRDLFNDIKSVLEVSGVGYQMVVDENTFVINEWVYQLRKDNFGNWGLDILNGFVDDDYICKIRSKTDKFDHYELITETSIEYILMDLLMVETLDKVVNGLGFESLNYSPEVHIKPQIKIIEREIKLRVLNIK